MQDLEDYLIRYLAKVKRSQTLNVSAIDHSLYQSVACWAQYSVPLFCWMPCWLNINCYLPQRMCCAHNKIFMTPMLTHEDPTSALPLCRVAVLFLQIESTRAAQRMRQTRHSCTSFEPREKWKRSKRRTVEWRWWRKELVLLMRNCRTNFYLLAPRLVEQSCVKVVWASASRV